MPKVQRIKSLYFILHVIRTDKVMPQMSYLKQWINYCNSYHGMKIWVQIKHLGEI